MSPKKFLTPLRDLFFFFYREGIRPTTSRSWNVSRIFAELSYVASSSFIARADILGIIRPKMEK